MAARGWSVALLALPALLALALAQAHARGQAARVYDNTILCQAYTSFESPVVSALPMTNGALLMHEDGSATMSQSSLVFKTALAAQPAMAASVIFRTSRLYMLGAVVLDDEDSTLSPIGEWDRVTGSPPQGRTGVRRLASTRTLIAAMTEDEAFFFAGNSSSLPFQSLSGVEDIKTSDHLLFALMKNGTILAWDSDVSMNWMTDHVFDQILEVETLVHGLMLVGVSQESGTVALWPRRKAAVEFSEFEAKGKISKVLGSFQGGVLQLVMLSETGELSIVGYSVPELIPTTGVADIALRKGKIDQFMLRLENGTVFMSDGELLGEDIREIGRNYLLSNEGEFIPLVPAQVVGTGLTRVDKVIALGGWACLMHDDGRISWVNTLPIPLNYTMFPTQRSEVRDIFISHGPTPVLVQVTQQGGAFMTEADAGHLLCARFNEPCMETVDIGLEDATVTPIEGGVAVLDSTGRFAVSGSLSSSRHAVPRPLDDVKSFSEFERGLFIINSTGGFVHSMADVDDCVILSDHANGTLSGIGYDTPGSESCVGLIGRQLTTVKNGEIGTIPGEYMAFVGMSHRQRSWFVVAENGTIFDSALQEVLGGRADTEIKDVFTGDTSYKLSVFWFENGTVAVVRDSGIESSGEQYLNVSCGLDSVCTGTKGDNTVQFWHRDKSMDFSVASNYEVVQIAGDRTSRAALYGVLTDQNTARLFIQEETGEPLREEELANVKQISIHKGRAVALTTDGHVRIFEYSKTDFVTAELELFESFAPIRSIHQIEEGTLLSGKPGEVHFIPEGATSLEELDAPWQNVRRVHSFESPALLEFEDGSGITVALAYKGGNRCFRSSTSRPTAQPTKSPSPAPTEFPTGSPTLSQAPTPKPTSSGAVSRAAPVIASACLVALLLSA